MTTKVKIFEKKKFTFLKGKLEITFDYCVSRLAILPEIELGWPKVNDKRLLGFSIDFLFFGILVIYKKTT